jgi:hypothetical protein
MTPRSAPKLTPPGEGFPTAPSRGEVANRQLLENRKSKIENLVKRRHPVPAPVPRGRAVVVPAPLRFVLRKI